MLENINIHSSVAVYVQIENHVQFAIASGRLKRSRVWSLIVYWSVTRAR